MKQITNKEYEEWQKYKAEKAKGHVLLPDTVRFMTEEFPSLNREKSNKGSAYQCRSLITYYFLLIPYHL